MASSATAPASTPHAPTGRHATREYVRTDDLVPYIEHYLGKRGSSIMALADAAGVSTRAVNKVLTRERAHQTVFLADKLMTAMGEHIISLETVFMPIKLSERPKNTACPGIVASQGRAA